MTTVLRDRPANRSLPPDPATDRGLFTRLGRAVVAHPGKVFLIWIIAIAAVIGISAALGQPSASVAEASQLSADKPSARAQHALDAAFGAPSTTQPPRWSSPARTGER